MTQPIGGRTGVLLAIDACVNLVLGLVLALAPDVMARFIGLPAPGSGLYVRALGAVLVGIAAALLVERSRGHSGLGLTGALIINLAGGAAVAAWLLLGGEELALRGAVTLWALVALLAVLSAVEGLQAVRRPPRDVG